MTRPEQLRLWLPAALIAAAVALLVGAAGHVLFEASLRRSAPTLDQATNAGAEAVGRTIAAQFSRAIGLGIPLDKLPDVEPYLKRIVQDSPQVVSLALLDETGRVLQSTGEPVGDLRFAIAAGDVAMTLAVAPESIVVQRAVNELRIILGIAALLSGVIAGVLVWGFAGFHQAPLRREFEGKLSRAATGSFDLALPAEGHGPMAQASRALAALAEKVEAARRRLAEAVATVRAIDFDGSLARRVDALLAPLGDAQVSLPEPASAGTAMGPVAWRMGILLGFAGAGFPLVANFGMDREPAEIARQWWPILPLLAELAAAAAGMFLGATRLGRTRVVLGLGCLILGLSLAATFWDRSYGAFILLRIAAGLGLGLAASALVAGQRLAEQFRNIFAVAVFALLIAGPVLSGLLTEAVGRRGAFLVLGAGVIAFVPFIAAVRREDGLSLPEPSGWIMRDARGGLAATPAALLVLFTIPSGFGYDNYLHGAGAMALLGLSALIAPAPPSVASGLALIVAALSLAALPGVWGLFAASAASGFAAGAMAKAAGAWTRRAWLFLAALAAIGLALAGMGVPMNALVAGCAILLLASHFAHQRV